MTLAVERAVKTSTQTKNVTTWVEVTGVCQNFLSLKYQILFLSFNIIKSNGRNIVKLNTHVRKTLNVTCGKFEHLRDSDTNGMIFCFS